MKMQRNAHPVVFVEGGTEIFESQNWYHSQQDGDEPHDSHYEVRHLESALSEGQRVHDADVPVQSYHRQRQHGHLAAHRADDARHVALPALAPRLVVRQVVAVVHLVPGADDEQVDAHQHVGEREVFDEERVDLVVLLQHAAPEQDDEVADAPQHGHDPHADAQHDVLEEVLLTRDAVSVGLALSLRDVGAVVKFIKIPAKKKDRCYYTQLSENGRHGYLRMDGEGDFNLK